MFSIFIILTFHEFHVNRIIRVCSLLASAFPTQHDSLELHPSGHLYQGFIPSYCRVVVPWYEMSGTGTSIETESKLVVASGLGWGNWDVTVNGDRISS